MRAIYGWAMCSPELGLRSIPARGDHAVLGIDMDLGRLIKRRLRKCGDRFTTHIKKAPQLQGSARLSMIAGAGLEPATPAL